MRVGWLRESSTITTACFRSNLADHDPAVWPSGIFRLADFAVREGRVNAMRIRILPFARVDHAQMELALWPVIAFLG